MAQKRTLEEIFQKSNLGIEAVETREPEREPEGERGLRGVATGVAKRGFKTLQGISKLGGALLERFNLPGQVAEFVTEGRVKAPEVEPLFTPEKEEKLEPVGVAEKIGQFAGGVAEFALPFSKISALTKTKGLLTRAFSEGVAGGVVGGIQEGELSSARDTAVLNAIFPIAGKVAAVTKKPIKDFAPRVINSLIKPLKKDMSFGKNPGRAVSEEGITASSLDELETNINSVLSQRVDDLNSIYAKSDEIFDLTATLKPIDDAMDVAAKQNNQAVLSRLQNTREALTNKLIRSTDENGREIIQVGDLRDLTKLNATDALQFKRDIGDITAFTGNPSDDKIVNVALQKIYGNIKGKLNTAIPESVALNEKVADLISAKVATKYRAEIAERGNLITFTPKVIGAGGLIASFATGNPIPFIVSIGAAGIEKALETPKAKTELAKWLASSSTEQKRELFQKAPFVKAIISETFLGVTR